MQPGYDWPGQDVGFFAVGLLGVEGGEGEEFERACKDSSERGRGPGTCRVMAGFNICGRLHTWGPGIRREVCWYPQQAWTTASCSPA